MSSDCEPPKQRGSRRCWPCRREAPRAGPPQLREHSCLPIPFPARVRSLICSLSLPSTVGGFRLVFTCDYRTNTTLTP